MNKKIIISLSIISAVGAIVIGVTTSYFSNTETSSNNTFIAGAIDLKIDNECHLNGRVCAYYDSNNGYTLGYYWNGDPTQEPCDCTWALMDLDGKAIFNFTDVKPGDNGEDTISLHVDSNPAWVCAEISNVAQYDNDCNTPEFKAETAEYGVGYETCDNPGLGEGELWDNLTFSIWMDNGAGANSCNNIKDTDETYLIENAKAANLTWPIADSQHGIPITDACIGVAWSVPDVVDNIIQSDSVTGDITFNAYQARNNNSFLCNPPQYVCGNDIVEPGEECDGDASQVCDAGGGYQGIKTCTQCVWSSCEPTESCGDGIINDNEQCDGTVFAPPYNNGNYTCDANCVAVYVPSCGNGTLDPNEQCDDANTIPGDGCNSVCVIEYCGDGIVNNNGIEECDDNNNTSLDGCSANCQYEAQLTVVKVMDNGDGGDNVAGDFQLYVNGSAVTSGQTYWYTPGAYVVSEIGVSGYDAEFSIECPDGNVTLADQDNKTCTVTNDDIKPNITLHKVVINDDTGTAGSMDFSMRIDGVLVPSGSSKSVTSNTAHSINEDAKAGYHFTSMSGIGSQGSLCPISLGGTVTLNEGEVITCTITNDDNP